MVYAGSVSSHELELAGVLPQQWEGSLAWSRLKVDFRISDRELGVPLYSIVPVVLFSSGAQFFRYFSFFIFFPRRRGWLFASRSSFVLPFRRRHCLFLVPVHGRAFCAAVTLLFSVDEEEEEEEAQPPIPKHEVVKKLRRLKAPITLFAETDWQR